MSATNKHRTMHHLTYSGIRIISAMSSLAGNFSERYGMVPALTTQLSLAAR
jgi:hypothetical protein